MATFAVVVAAAAVATAALTVPTSVTPLDTLEGVHSIQGPVFGIDTVHTIVNSSDDVGERGIQTLVLQVKGEASIRMGCSVVDRRMGMTSMSSLVRKAGVRTVAYCARGIEEVATLRWHSFMALTTPQAQARVADGVRPCLLAGYLSTSSHRPNSASTHHIFRSNQCDLSCSVASSAQ